MTKSTQQLHDLGQSIWLDNITRDLLDHGVLAKYIAELNVTGLTSNPTIFDQGITSGSTYDKAIAAKAKAGLSGEDLFVEIALEDLCRAADLFKGIWESTKGVDGWVSMEVSPLLASDTKATVAAALKIHKQANRKNLFVKIPGTPEGIPAIEEAIFAGVPINVTLLFSREHYLAAAEAYMRGIERRIAAGLDPKVESVASVFVSRWDAAAGNVGADLHMKLGIATSGQTYKAYIDLLASPRFKKLEAAGAHAQRLLWASTGTKDPKASDTLYIEAFGAPNTVDTMPEKTLLAFADHGGHCKAMATDGGNAEEVLAAFGKAGVDVKALALKLQVDGAASFVKSWEHLMDAIKTKSAALADGGK